MFATYQLSAFSPRDFFPLQIWYNVNFLKQPIEISSWIAFSNQQETGRQIWGRDGKPRGRAVVQLCQTDCPKFITWHQNVLCFWKTDLLPEPLERWAIFNQKCRLQIVKSSALKVYLTTEFQEEEKNQLKIPKIKTWIFAGYHVCVIVSALIGKHTQPVPNMSSNVSWSPTSGH